MSTAEKCFPATCKKKTSFATTCNRLSFFLREKGTLKDLKIVESFDFKGKPEISTPMATTTTADLLSSIECTLHKSAKKDEMVNYLPQYVNLDTFCDVKTNKAGSGEVVVSTVEPKTAQMTIMYRGEVLVFDHVSAEKARDLVLAARGASLDNQIQNRIHSNTSISSGLELNGLDLPIARRASLHTFLRKRKERASVTAPYQLNKPSIAAASLCHKFDLNL